MKQELNQKLRSTIKVQSKHSITNQTFIWVKNKRSKNMYKHQCDLNPGRLLVKPVFQPLDHRDHLRRVGECSPFCPMCVHTCVALQLSLHRNGSPHNIT